MLWGALEMEKACELEVKVPAKTKVKKNSDQTIKQGGDEKTWITVLFILFFSPKMFFRIIV